MISLMVSEFRREIRIWWSYRLNAVLEIIIYALAISVLMVIFRGMAESNGATYDIHEQTASIVGVLVWHLCMRTMVQFSNAITEEAETGTLETVIVTAVSPVSVLFARGVAMSTVRGAQTIMMGAAFVFLLQLQFQFSLWAIAVIFVTLAGTFGLGIAFAGFTLIHKQTNNMANLVATLSIFAAGVLVPINSLNLVFTILKLALPITWGTDILRKLLISGQGAGSESLIGDLIGLTIQSIIMIVIGIAVFNLGLRRARREATLATY
jgi:ABC-2 type transport system permease protein